MAGGRGIGLAEAPYILCCSMRDPGVPRRAKLLAVFLLAYILSPVDLIPDVIPILGLLDEVVIVPLVLRAICRLIPPARLEVYRSNSRAVQYRGLLPLLGVFIVTGIWALVVYLAYLSLQML